VAKPRRTVTAVRDARGGRVAVELDGELWRELPLDAAARAGLSVGTELDRERLRTLARELRRARALGTALGALRRRDLSRGALDERLARSGVREGVRSEALGALERVGLVDDERVARLRAAALAERGWGDEAIRYRLLGERVEPVAIDAALCELEPESVRAGRIVTRRGVGLATARFLARRGFGEDAVEAAGSDPE
jgi:SOS response regulatory protein OraA/RecX